MSPHGMPRNVVVAKPAVTSDQRWREYGRPHFLNRTLYEATRPMTDTPVTPLPGPLGQLVGLALLLMPLVLLWRATLWAFPWLPGVMRPVTRLARRTLRSLHVTVWTMIWRNPMRNHGCSVTLWCWWVVATTLLTLVLLVRGELIVLLVFPIMAAVTLGWWLVLRWWRLRMLQPRPLPRRRL